MGIWYFARFRLLQYCSQMLSCPASSISCSLSARHTDVEKNQVVQHISRTRRSLPQLLGSPCILQERADGMYQKALWFPCCLFPWLGVKTHLDQTWACGSCGSPFHYDTSPLYLTDQHRNNIILNTHSWCLPVLTFVHCNIHTSDICSVYSSHISTCTELHSNLEHRTLSSFFHKFLSPMNSGRSSYDKQKHRMTTYTSAYVVTTWIH